VIQEAEELREENSKEDKDTSKMEAGLNDEFDGRVVKLGERELRVRRRHQQARKIWS